VAPSAPAAVERAQPDGTQRRSTPREQASPSQGSPTDLEILVVDDRSDPIETATVSALVSKLDREIALGSTDSAGLLLVQRKPDLPAILRIACAGYLTEEILLEENHEPSVKVQLQPSTIASGSVVSIATGQGVPGVRVLIWPANTLLPPWDLAERARNGNDVRGLSTTSGEQGRFEVMGVKPELRYAAVAAGAGVASLRPASFIPGAEPVLLEVGHLYGSRVELLVNDEERRLDDVATPLILPLQPHIPDATHLDQPSFVPVLAGLADRTTFGSIMANEYLFVSASDLDSIGPLEFRLNVPGFDPVSESIRFFRVRNAIPVHSIALLPAEGPSAWCRFYLDWPPGFDPSSVDMIGDLGRIQIHPRSGSGSGSVLDVDLRVQTYGDSEWSVHLPYGDYEARFDVTSTPATAPHRTRPPTPFRATDGGVEVHFDLKDCGGIRLEVQTRTGQQASGSLTVLLLEGDVQPGGEAVGVHVLLKGAPFLIAPLHAGTYTIAVLGHSFLNLRSVPHVVTVVPGVWERLKLAPSK